MRLALGTLEDRVFWVSTLKDGLIREGTGSGQSTTLFRLVKGRNGLHIDILGLKVLMETSGRRPGARFDSCEEFIKGQLNRRADDVEMIGIV